MRYTVMLSLFILVSSFLAVYSQPAPLWLRYPAISPDGKTIAFCYRGDIYLVAQEGGKATHLTQHDANDIIPVWSHDSKTIAFASDRYGNFDIFRVSVDTGARQRLTYHSSHDIPGGFSHDDRHLLFSSTRIDSVQSQLFPSYVLSELYRVPSVGGRVEQVLTTPAENAVYTDKGDILYHDVKGYEDPWRKHHSSSVARDVWLYDSSHKKHSKLTDFNGEDRNPQWADGIVYYLSEQSGSFNVWKFSLDNREEREQLTHYDKHPVRFLSRSQTGVLCFGYDGEIYTMREGEKPRKVAITITTADKYNSREMITVNNGITEIAISPNGKELAFLVRGEIFVTSLEHTVTKRITNTPEQERSISFSPDGRSILYASERNGSWNIYQSSLARDEEKYFCLSTTITEKVVLESAAETFQPSYSPDGKEVAYLEERTILKVVDLESRKARTVLEGIWNYSYIDGDQWFRWSPDGKWFLVVILDNNRWMGEIGLVAADGKSPVINITQSGYDDWAPKWSTGGKMIVWTSDRHGMRSHGSWGSQRDAYGIFCTQAAYDEFLLRKEERDLLPGEEKSENKNGEEKNENKNGKEKKDAKEEKKELEIELLDIEERQVRLTIHSSDLASALVSPKGDALYYLCQFERGYDLWVHNFYKQETKLLAKLRGGGNMQLLWADDGNNLIVLSRGKIYKVNAQNGSLSGVAFQSHMMLDRHAERAHLFEHVWRQVKKKFYVADLHGIDWEYYKAAYAKFLPHINNDRDFAELLGEMLGELNASHTGARYRNSNPTGDSTAALGAFFDGSFAGPGIKVAEVLAKGPLAKADSKITAGTVIEKIDGMEIRSDDNYYQLLNHKAGQLTLLSLRDPKTGQRWEQVIRPISAREKGELLYQRWVKQRHQLTEKLSDGKLGYVHIRSMNDASFRVAFSEILGRNNDKLALIVDTRFNGGGWLHDDLATLLSGKSYMKFSPRKQENLGGEPIFKWTKPSIVIMGEGNYSDAHMFPYTYKSLGIGKLVGMPVPGTGTAVWWEWLFNGTILFGIPQVGMIGNDGKYLENNQLEPDIKVANDPELVAAGRDQQLEEAVQELLRQVGK